MMEGDLWATIRINAVSVMAIVALLLVTAH
jgi:hypothetical protein